MLERQKQSRGIEDSVRACSDGRNLKLGAEVYVPLSTSRRASGLETPPQGANGGEDRY